MLSGLEERLRTVYFGWDTADNHSWM